MNLQSTNVANNSAEIDTQPIPHRSVSQHFLFALHSSLHGIAEGPGTFCGASWEGGRFLRFGQFTWSSMDSLSWEAYQVPNELDEHTRLWLELYNIMCIYICIHTMYIYIYICVCVNHVYTYIYIHTYRVYIYIYMCIYLYIPYTYTVHTVIMPHDHCYKPVQLCPKPRKSSSKLTLSTTVSLVSLEMCRLYTCWDTSLICCRVRTLDLIYIAQEYNISKHPNLQKKTQNKPENFRGKKSNWNLDPCSASPRIATPGPRSWGAGHIGEGSYRSYQGPSVEICWKNTVVKN